MRLTYKEETSIRVDRIKNRVWAELKIELDEFLVRAKNHANLVIQTNFDPTQSHDQDRVLAGEALMAALAAIGLEEVGAAIEASQRGNSGAIEATEAADNVTD